MSPRVLLVDDNAVIARMIVDLLSAEGIDVAVAADADACLRFLAQTRPDCILMDVQLPGVDGLSLTRRIRTSFYNDVPIVALTSYAMRGDRERMLVAGCDGYIAKPFDTRTFAGIVAGFLPKRAG